MDMHSWCAEDPGAWVEVTECSSEWEYFQITANPGPAPEGVQRRGYDSDVKILLEHRSPIECWLSEGGCTGQQADLKDQIPSGYNVYVGRGCRPNDKNFNAYMDMGDFQSKQISIAINDKATYFIGVHHREGQACNYTMSTGALYAAKANQAASCGWGGKMNTDQLESTPVCKAQTAEKLSFCDGGEDCGKRIFPEVQGAPVVAIVVPIVLIILVGAVVFGVFYAKKKKKDARMGKFAALSKGGGGATGATGGGAASAVAEA